MFKLNSKTSLILLIPLTLIVGSFASANTGTDLWYQGLIKSDLNPPGYVFGIVWPILYLLMGITAWRTFYKLGLFCRVVPPCTSDVAVS